MASKTEVANLALSMVGEPSIISLTDPNEGAKAANLWFDTARDAVLEDHLWNFAMKRTTLATVSGSPEFGFDNKYKLPNDFIRLVAFDPEAQPNYRIEGEEIVTDSDNPELLYVRRVTNLNLWPAAVRMALASRLAHEIAPSLKNNQTDSDTLWQRYQAKLSLARSYDGQQNPPRVIEADEFVNARFGFNDFVDPRYRDIE